MGQHVVAVDVVLKLEDGEQQGAGFGGAELAALEADS